MRIIWRLIVGLLAVVGLMVVLVAALLGGGIWWLKDRVEVGSTLPDQIVLVADLRPDLPEAPSSLSLTSLDLRPALTVSDLVLALDRAGVDPRVKGLVARLDATSHGFGVAQELRDAVQRFRASGKFAYAFAESFGELSSGNEGYYIATAFDEIDMQPVGLVGLTGAMAEVPFGRKLLDTLGVGLAVSKREQFKTAMDSFTETGLTPANREMLDSILDSYEGQLVDGIVSGRKLDAETVRALIDGGPYTDAESLDLKLVDKLDYWEQVTDRARSKAGGRLIGLRDYQSATAGQVDDGAVPVAFIRASGMIQSGSGLGGGIHAAELASAIGDATDSPAIKAILMRIDSPGGSAVASETIAHQVRLAIDQGKPVIVSMGNTAGSGGYWIAMDATRILAQPGTLTGSIGVIAGKPVLAGLWDKLGIEWAELPRGQNADIWSMNQDYDEQGRARVESILDSLYASFKQGVARGRGMTPERVEEIAKGRVWTGAQARDLGLIDGLGGLFEAEQAVRDTLKLPAGNALDLQPYPSPQNPVAAALGAVRDRLGVLAGIGHFIGMIGPRGPATMPAFGID